MDYCYDAIAKSTLIGFNLPDNAIQCDECFVAASLAYVTNVKARRTEPRRSPANVKVTVNPVGRFILKFGNETTSCESIINKVT